MDVRKGVRSLGEHLGLPPGVSEQVFYSSLLTPSAQSSPERQALVLAIFELSLSQERLTLLHACLDYLRSNTDLLSSASSSPSSSSSSSSVSSSVLSLLTLLARIPSPQQSDPSTSQTVNERQAIRKEARNGDLSLIAKKLLAARKVLEKRNMLISPEENEEGSRIKQWKTQLARSKSEGQEHLGGRATVPLEPVQVMLGDAETISFDYVAQQVERSDAREQQGKHSTDREYRDPLKTIQTISPDVLDSVWNSRGPQFQLLPQSSLLPDQASGSSKTTTLFGALVHPRRVVSGVEFKLSLPHLDKENDTTAPDPMGVVISTFLQQTNRKLTHQQPPQPKVDDVEKSKTTRTWIDVSQLLDRKEDVVWTNPAVWRSRRERPRERIFGWEEQMPKSFRVQQSTDENVQAVQFASYAMLGFERGDKYFDYQMQREGYFAEEPSDIKTLLRDCVFALTGVESKHFQKVHTLIGAAEFLPMPSRILGTSAESVSCVLSCVAQCANSYERLLWVVRDSSPLLLSDVGPSLKEALADYVLGYQHAVMELSSQLGKNPSVLFLRARVMALHKRLEMILDVFDDLHRIPTNSLDLLEKLYRSTCREELGTMSVSRKLVEVGLSGVIQVIHSWLFQCADGAEHFDGDFLCAKEVDDRGSWTSLLCKLLDPGCDQSSDEDLPVSFHLPSFFRSTIRRLDAGLVAKRIILCGCMLRVLQEADADGDIFPLVTNDSAKVLSSLLPVNLRSTPEMNRAAARAISRTRAIVIDIQNHCQRMLRRRAQDQAQQLELAVEQRRVSRQRAVALLERLEREMHQASEVVSKRNKEAYENLRVAAEEARKQRERELQEQRRRDLEDARQATDLPVSPISFQERQAAEAYLMAQVEAFLAQHEGQELSPPEQASLQALHRSLDELKRAEPHRAAGGSPTSIVVLQEPGGKSSLRGWFEASPETNRPSVRVVKGSSGESQLKEHLDENSVAAVPKPSVKIVRPVHLEDDATKPSTKVFQHPGGTATLGDYLQDSSVPQPNKQSVKVSQAPGGASSVQEYLNETSATEKEKQAVKVIQAPGGTSSMHQHLDEKSTTQKEKQSVKVSQAPGGASSMQEYLNETSATEKEKQAVKVIQAPGGTSPMHQHLDEKSTTQKEKQSVKVSQAPGGASSMQQYLDETTAAQKGKQSVRVAQAPGGASSMRDFLSDSNSQPHHRPSVKVSQPPGGSTSAKQSTRHASAEQKEAASTKRKEKKVIANATEEKGEEWIREKALDPILQCQQPPVQPHCISFFLHVEDTPQTKEEEEEEDDDGDVAPIDVVLEYGVVESILQQCKVIEFALARVIRDYSNLVEYLDGLKRYFLMSQGDLFCSIVDWFCDTYTKRIDLRQAKGKHLETLVENQLSTSGAGADLFSSNFHYRLSSETMELFQSFERFEFLEAACDLGWPLNILLSQNSMKQLDGVHRFLLSIKFCHGLSKLVWQALKQERKERLFPWLNWRWHQVRHLLTTFEGYILTQLLHEQWSALMEEVGKQDENTPAHLVDSLQRFLGHACTSCFLDNSRGSELIRKCVHRALRKVVVFFECSMQALAQGARQPSRELNAAWKEFASTQTFLVKTLAAHASVAIPGAAGGAKSLLTHIDFNHYFEKM